jgi:hypothetical protein
MNMQYLVEKDKWGSEHFRIESPILKDIVLLVMWRDESVMKRKARAIQRIIDRKIEQLNDEETKALNGLAREFNFKVSAW